MGFDDDSTTDKSAITISIKLSGLWISVIFFIITVISFWYIFIKTGRPGWPAIIPFYNYIVLLNIIDKPYWWLFLLFIPAINLIIHVIVMCKLGDCFDKSVGFKLGLICFPYIFLLILAFDDSQYTAPLTIQYFLYPSQ